MGGVTPPPHTGDMTTQLSLITSPPADASRRAGSSESARRTGGTGRSRGTRRGTGRRYGTVGTLDRRTIEAGRRGVAAARAALAEATARVRERELALEAEREAELHRLAEAARRSAA